MGFLEKGRDLQGNGREGMMFGYIHMSLGLFWHCMCAVVDVILEEALGKAL